MAKHVMTVRGEVSPDQLGYTDAHSHIWIDPVAGGNPAAPVLNDAPAIAAELRDFRETRGGAIIDCQPANCGRNANHLYALSAAADVHIVACTGFHLRMYYADDNAPLWSMTAEQACTFIVDEIRHGLTETRDAENRVYPGFIKIAAEASLDASPLHLFEAAAYAALKTGYAIEIHTERGAAIEDFLQFFRDIGLSPARLVFCHVDKRPDFALHREMAQADVMLEYDTFYRPKYDPENNVWKLLSQMIEAGLAAQVSLATDMAGGDLWQRLGNGPGLTAFFTHIKARLQALGIEPGSIQDLMGGNIANRLALERE